MSLLGGHLVVWGLRNGLYHWRKVDEVTSEPSIPGWVIGFTERSVFTLLVAGIGELPGSLTAVVVPAFLWIGLKMAVHWQVSIDPAKKGGEKDIESKEWAHAGTRGMIGPSSWY